MAPGMPLWAAHLPPSYTPLGEVFLSFPRTLVGCARSCLQPASSEHAPPQRAPPAEPPAQEQSPGPFRLGQEVRGGSS